MKNITNKLNKKLTIPIYIIMILSVFSFFRSCSNSSQNNKLKNEIKTLSDNIHILDSTIESKTYNKVEQIKLFEIEGYKISKRFLYDNNKIIRTVERPDDMMNSYDEKIEELKKELK